MQTAIGHWCEMMFPLYSILRTEPGFARPAAQFVLLHLKRSHLMEWVRPCCRAWRTLPACLHHLSMQGPQARGTVSSQPATACCCKATGHC